MRVKTSAGAFRAQAIAGTHAVMLALDCDQAARAGLLGFTFRRGKGTAAPKPLRSLKVFESVMPKPKPGVDEVFTDKFPIQSFLWGDYTAEPGTAYTFEVVPVYGEPAALEPREALKLTLNVVTEKEDDGKHGIWFNRGAIASQAYARQFKNHKPTKKEMDDPDDKHTKWLSRGLLEACLDTIDSTKEGEALRACMYEFTYKPIIEAFKRKVDAGFDVQLIVHKDKDGKNEKAMRNAGLNLTHDGKRVVIHRTRPPIPHNKFIIKLDGETPQQVWTGSTNVTPSGFLGQSNVGHLIRDAGVAGQFLKYWTVLSDNPTTGDAVPEVAAFSPFPPALVKPDTQTCIFSPRASASMLNWYADRMGDATSSIMFTAAFTVAEDFIEPLGRDRDFLRFVLKEKPPTAEERKALKGDRDLVISYGAVLGAEFFVKDGKIVQKRKVKGKTFPLDKWFMKEELTRDQGNIFFVHTKFLLIDPLSDDPLVCTGSANFSGNSLTSNDENMVLIRGSTRVADIYMTEFDRLFRHFYFRDVANETASKLKKGQRPQKAFLDEDDKWTDSYFFQGGFKTRRREMFFNLPADNWIKAAALHSNDEPVRPKKKKAKKKVVKKKKATKKS